MEVKDRILHNKMLPKFLSDSLINRISNRINLINPLEVFKHKDWVDSINLKASLLGSNLCLFKTTKQLLPHSLNQQEVPSLAGQLGRQHQLYSPRLSKQITLYSKEHNKTSLLLEQTQQWERLLLQVVSIYNLSKINQAVD